MKVFKIARPVNTENFAIRVLYKSNKIQDTRYKQITNSNIQTSKTVIARSSKDEAIYSKEIAAPQTKLVARNDNTQRPTRIGIVISNKIDKRATRRNELKRKIRAIVREILPEINGGHDIIIQVKKAPEYPYNFQAIKAQIESVFKKS